MGLLSAVYRTPAEVGEHLGHLGSRVNLISSLPPSLSSTILQIPVGQLRKPSTVLGVKDSVVKKIVVLLSWSVGRRGRFSDIRLKIIAYDKFMSTI